MFRSSFRTLFLVLGFWLSSLSLAIASDEMPHAEVRAIAKNMMMMVGFYSECAKEKLVKINRRTIRFTSFSAAKYAEITGDRDSLDTWANQGSKGFLILDPTVSAQTKKVPLNEQYCLLIKSHLDRTWHVFETSIIQ